MFEKVYEIKFLHKQKRNEMLNFRVVKIQDNRDQGRYTDREGFKPSFLIQFFTIFMPCGIFVSLWHEIKLKLKKIFFDKHVKILAMTCFRMIY